jgi:CheY-like chemotaxis protein
MADKKVMVVDDEEDFVEVISVTLESNGFEVVSANSGAEAQEKIPEENPDVIVLDVMMETHTKGFEVARWLRGREDTKEIPIIMLTGVNQEYPFDFGPDDMWLPVDKFINKPVPAERLLAEVQNAVK